MDYTWQSRLRKALAPEILHLQRLIDAHTDRYFRFGDYADQVHADALRRKLTDLKQEILRAERLQQEQRSEQTQHS